MPLKTQKCCCPEESSTTTSTTSTTTTTTTTTASSTTSTTTESASTTTATESTTTTAESGVSTGCCPNTLPTTLFATFSQVTGNCSCADGTVIELTYNEAEDRWEGEGDFGTCGSTMKIRFLCDDTLFRLLVWNCNNLFVDEGTRSDFQCTPLNAEWQEVPLSLDCCGTSDNTATITVTE